jgi:tRNA(fMet)-specific endonuclease VapC
MFIGASNELGGFESGLVAKLVNPTFSVVSGGIGTLAAVVAAALVWPQIRAYGRLIETVRFFATVPILPFNESCEIQFQKLRAHKLRTGSQDLRIAATAMVWNLTVVTRNRRDFEQIPGLAIEDWSIDYNPASE